MRLTTCLLIGLLIVGVAGGVRAEEAEKPDVRKYPGYVDFDPGAILGGIEPRIEICVPRSLLTMIGAAAREEEPELSGLMSKLALVRVQVFEDIESGQASKLRKKVMEAAKNLQKAGWENVVRVREDQDKVDILLKTTDGSIAGLVVFVVKACGELVFVNIVGELDPALLGRLGANLNLEIPQLNLQLPGDKADAPLEKKDKGARSDE